MNFTARTQLRYPTKVAAFSFACLLSAATALAQFAIPPIPLARPEPGSDSPTVREPVIPVTASPGPGDLLFDFNFDRANVSLISVALPDAREDQVEGGIRVPVNLLSDPASFDAVVIRLLDKVTTKLETQSLPIGETISFGTLTIDASVCLKNPSTRTPESAAHLRIWDQPGAAEPEQKFEGWMFASSPALNALDHPIYDVWVIDCTAAQAQG